MEKSGDNSLDFFHFSLMINREKTHYFSGGMNSASQIYKYFSNFRRIPALFLKNEDIYCYKITINDNIQVQVL